MGKWYICPHWASEHSHQYDSEGRLVRIRYQVTEIAVTNPSAFAGQVQLAFYEARGDGNYYPADWASGRWSMPAKYQRYYRPDPSLTYGSEFSTYGWFELLLSSDDLVVDVRISEMHEYLLVLGSSVGEFNNRMEDISQRTVNLVPKPVPLTLRVSAAVLRRDLGARLLGPAAQQAIDDRLSNEPFRPNTASGNG